MNSFPAGTAARAAGRRIRRAGVLMLIPALLLVSGCVVYTPAWYGYDDSGVYYGEPVYDRAGPARTVVTVNPALYPYWSLDYFYFSNLVHPYSVYVGYYEPLYYPYPGWALWHPYPGYGGYGHSAGFGFGFGYPWHGAYDHYAYWSGGFFAGDFRHGHDRHYHDDHRFAHTSRQRLRAIDRRLAGLEQSTREFDRRALVGQDRLISQRRAAERYDDRTALRPVQRARLIDRREIRSAGAPARRDPGRDLRRDLQRRSSRDLRSTAPPRSGRESTERRSPAHGGSADRRTIDRGIPVAGLRGRVLVTDPRDRWSERRTSQPRAEAQRIYQGRIIVGSAPDRSAQPRSAWPGRSPAPARDALVTDRIVRSSAPNVSRRDRPATRRPEPAHESRDLRAVPSVSSPTRDRAGRSASGTSRRAILRGGHRSGDRGDNGSRRR